MRVCKVSIGRVKNESVSEVKLQDSSKYEVKLIHKGIGA